jgi:iron(III) transport system ATP-binding protein
MRAGRFEQVGTPEHVFEEPATEYVAGFIGMSNRLPLVHDGASWTFAGERVDGDLRLAGTPTEVTARLRPDDLLLAPRAEDLPAGSIAWSGKVVDSQFGGRHMDVVARVNDERLAAQVPSIAFGGWARKLDVDQEVAMGFDPTSAVYYDGEGKRIAGHVNLAAAPTAVAAVGE